MFTRLTVRHDRNPSSCYFNDSQLSLVVRKPVFGISDQVGHKPGCTVTQDRRSLKFRFSKLRDCTIYVAKTKALISFAVTAKLICVFVFAYAKSRFSHDEAQFLFREQDLCSDCIGFWSLINFYHVSRGAT